MHNDYELPRAPRPHDALATLRDMRHDAPCPHIGCKDCKRKDAAIEAVSDLIEEAGFLLRDVEAGNLQPLTLANFRTALANCGVSA